MPHATGKAFWYSKGTSVGALQEKEFSHYFPGQFWALDLFPGRIGLIQLPELLDFTQDVE